jgi:hypothetical protein
MTKWGSCLSKPQHMPLKSRVSLGQTQQCDGSKPVNGITGNLGAKQI